MTRQCAECLLIKSRLIIREPDNKHHYADNRGRWWKGDRCPDCIKSDHKNPSAWGMRAIRKCRVCLGSLTLDRYFNCKACVQGGFLDNHNLEGNYVY